MSSGKPGYWLVAGASLAVVATIAIAISVLGSPAAQRDLRMDQRRVDDLERIASASRRYLRANKALPPNLEALARQPGLRLSIADPVAGTPYAYQVTGDRSIRLCADFVTDTAMLADDHPRGIEDEWLHAAGRQCFNRDFSQKSQGD